MEDVTVAIFRASEDFDLLDGRLDKMLDPCLNETSTVGLFYWTSLKTSAEFARLTIREATAADVPALVELHVRTWRATYEAIEGHALPEAPTIDIRSWQWRKVFDEYDGSTFVFVVEDNGRLVGFASGRPFESPEFPGELSKVYLDEAYKRRGLGRRLFGHVARRFLEQGIDAMTLYADARNPACQFFERLGGRVVKVVSEEDVWYGWRDLEALAQECPIE